MAVKYSTAARNAAVDALVGVMGTGAVLELRSGAAPGAITDADSGTLIASITLPTPYMAAASGGVAQMTGTWQDLAADAAGTIGHYRIKNGATTHMQGSVTITGGGGEMTVDNPALTAGQSFVVTSFSITAGGA